MPGEALPKSPPVTHRPLMLSFAGTNAADTTLHIYSLLLFDELAIQLMNNCLMYSQTFLTSCAVYFPESSASQNYSLRPRIRNLQTTVRLPAYASHLVDSNFLILFTNVYYHLLALTLSTRTMFINVFSCV